MADNSLTSKLQEAAEIVAAEARRIASSFSKRIPLNTTVQTSADGSVRIITDGRTAPNAASFEDAQRHPVFGHQDRWVKQDSRPYMEIAFEIHKDEVDKKAVEWAEDLARKALG